MTRKLFAPVAEAERRSQRIPVLVNAGEKKEIQLAAAQRDLEVGEFMRRAALGRRADLSYQTEIVLTLSDLTRAIRAVHAEIARTGTAPPEQAMLSLILDARAAMSRLAG